MTPAENGGHLGFDDLRGSLGFNAERFDLFKRHFCTLRWPHKLVGILKAPVIMLMVITLFSASALASPSYLRLSMGSPQHQGLPFTVTVTAYAADSSLDTTYNGPLTLTASNATGQVDLSGGVGLTFTNGLWSGTVSISTNEIALTLNGETSGGIAGNVSFNVLPLNLQTVSLLVEDMVYDPTRHRIFASVQSSVPIYSNSVVRINPDSGAIEAAVAVGPITPPQLLTFYLDGRLAVSDNGQYLYVAFSNAAFVQRIELATMTAGPSFSLPVDGSGRVSGVANMEVLPGQPLSVAVLAARFDIFVGLLVFDSGVVRAPNTIFSADYKAVARAPSSSLLYALGSLGFTRMSVTTNGITVIDAIPFDGSGGGSIQRLESEGNYCFTGSGAVLDPITPKSLGKFGGLNNSSFVASDVTRRRVCFNLNFGTTYWIQPRDLDTLQALREIQFPKSFDYTRRFLRCGNTYVFSTSIGQIFLVQSPLLTPSGPGADLSVVGQSFAPQPVLQGSNLTMTLTVSNAGPGTATDVVITDSLDAVGFLSAVPSQGQPATLNGSTLTCNLGNLGAGSNATLSISVRPTIAGWLSNRVTVIANELDTNLIDNVSMGAFFSQINSTSNSVGVIRLPTRDLAYAPTTGRLYASVPTNGMVVSNALVPIDPQTGLFEAAVLSVNDPGRLAISDDGQMLYCGGGSNRTIFRVDLPAGTSTLSFPVGSNYSLDDMAVLPVQGHSLAISRRVIGGNNVGIAIYDDGVPRPLSTGVVPQTDRIGFGPTADTLYVYNRPPVIGARSFRRLNVTASGLTTRDTNTTLITGSGEDFRCAAGLIFTTGGSLIDPQTRTKLGSVGNLVTSSLVETDPASGRLFYLIPTGSASQWTLRSFDLRTLAPLGFQTVNNIVGTPGRLIRFGNDGLAFRTTGDQLFLIRTPMVASTAATDLAVTWDWSSPSSMVGSNFTFSLTVTNRGPQIASNVVGSLLLPASFAIISATASQGTVAVSNQTAFSRVTALSNGSSFVLNVQAQATKVGLFRFFAGVLSANSDLQPMDNELEFAVPVNAAGKMNLADELAASSRDMVLNPANGCLLASVGSFGTNDYAIVSIDPLTGQATLLKEMETDPGRLAVTENGSSLYVGSVPGDSVSRLDLGSLSLSPFASLTAGRVLQDMEVLPGYSNSVALSWQVGVSRGIEINDSGVIRSNAPVGSDGGQVLEFGNSAAVLYANGRELSGAGRFRQFTVDSTGLAENWWLAESLVLGEDIRFDSGLIYSSRGKVINPDTHSITSAIPALSIDALVAPLRQFGRLFYLTKSGVNWYLQSYDSQSLALMGSVTVTNVLGTPSRLTFWGTNGFAFRTSSNQVFLVRTDLIPANSGLRLACKLGSSGFEFSFPSTTGRVYRIERSTNLLSGVWQIEADNLPGTGSNIVFNVPAAALVANGFYRVLLKP